MTTPHVPLPFEDLVVMAVFAALVGGAAAVAISLFATELRHRFRRAASVAFALVAVGTFAIMVQTRATERMFGGYFSSKSPRERFRDHLADFEEQVVRDPEIRSAIDGFPDASAKLQDLATRGVPRLDDATLRKRAILMTALLSRLGDHACLSVLHRAAASEGDGWELEDAMVHLGADFVSQWMQVLHQAMLAEVRKAPIPVLSLEATSAAYQALEAKIGVNAAQRLVAGLRKGAPPSECCWAGRTIYRVAPTLAEPHGTVLLRLMAQSG